MKQSVREERDVSIDSHKELIMVDSPFLTFSEYVEDIRACHCERVAAWSRRMRMQEVLRLHGGDEFRDFSVEDKFEVAGPTDIVLPAPPDVSLVGPYARITLISIESDPHVDMEYYFPSRMIVFHTSGDRIEGFIYEGPDHYHGHTAILVPQVIECISPLREHEGEGEPLVGLPAQGL